MITIAKNRHKLTFSNLSLELTSKIHTQNLSMFYLMFLF